MILQFNKKAILIFGSLLLLVVISFVVFYFFKLKPMTVKITQLTTSIVAEEELLTSYERRSQKAQEKVIEDSTDLQEKLPVSPLLEQFLLDIEKAEVVSNSFISSMSFSETDITVNPQEKTNKGTTLQDKVEGAGQIDEAKSIQNNGRAEVVQPNGDLITPPPDTVPPGMKRLTVTLSVQSPDFYAMISFLQTIEDLERITKIDSLSFKGNEEKTVISKNENEPLEYSLTISTFYHPGLKELQDELPPLETPKPGNKVNPLAQANMFDQVLVENSNIVNN